MKIQPFPRNVMTRASVCLQVTVIMILLSCTTHTGIKDGEQYANRASGQGIIDTTIGYQYPSYLVGEYQKTLADIHTAHTPESAIILFATDLHYSFPGSNYYEYALMNGINNLFGTIRKMSTDVSPDLCVYGGDYVQLPLPGEGQTKAMGFKTLDFQLQQMRKISTPQFLIIGNHERYYSGNSNSAGMTNDEFYEYVQRPFVDNGTVKQAGNSKMLFYRDDPKTKLRYLFISTPDLNFKPLYNDLTTICNDTPEDYALLVFNHFTGSRENGIPKVYSAVAQCINHIQHSGKELVAWIGGHNHADMSYVHNGTLVISCLQSGYLTPDISEDGVKYEHRKDHYTESALSVIIIRKDLGKIFIKRMGLGRDREFNYNTKSGPIGLTGWTD